MGSPVKSTPPVIRDTTPQPSPLQQETKPVRDTQAELEKLFGFVPPTGEPKTKVKKTKKRTEIEEAHKKLEQQVSQILDSSTIADAEGEGGISLEEMELEQQIL